MIASNSYIHSFLDYYFNLQIAPEYGVLIKGPWGCGKTWFVKQVLSELHEESYLYVSLYGVTRFSEIEYQFFQQLHPVLSSKGMELAGKVIKGMLKATIKLDLDSDHKSDGKLDLQATASGMLDYLKIPSKQILIFDDLERCSIPVAEMLGYINHFVEHQGYKAIIICHEDEIISKESEKDEKVKSYEVIKEKLIGKTFEVQADIDNVLTHFVDSIENGNLKQLYRENGQLLKALFQCSKSNNFRHLRQVLWDFERFYMAVSDKALKNETVMCHLLRLFFAYSFEIRSGTLSAKQISSLRPEFYAGIYDDSKKKGKSPYQILQQKYPDVPFNEPLLSEALWVEIFDKGYLDKEVIAQAIENCVYFRTDTTPNWVKLWHYRNLRDEEFCLYINEIETSLQNREIVDLGMLRHMVGMLLFFSNHWIYPKSKDAVLRDAKAVVDDLKITRRLDVAKERSGFMDNTSYGGLAFLGQELDQFREFKTYLSEKIDELQTETYPEQAKDLLDLMQTDADRFIRQLELSNNSDSPFYEIPILHHIEPDDFVRAFLELSPANRLNVAKLFKHRFQSRTPDPKLREEYPWLEACRELLLKERKKLQGKLSGMMLETFIEHSFGGEGIFGH